MTKYIYDEKSGKTLPENCLVEVINDWDVDNGDGDAADFILGTNYLIHENDDYRVSEKWIEMSYNWLDNPSHNDAGQLEPTEEQAEKEYLTDEFDGC